jgi:holo-[acyl-carrier protein] synthase
MILAVGIDTVEVHRFDTWHTKSNRSMRRIFSEEEIAYCLQHTRTSPERFAVRFAAKEACTKALSGMLHPHVVPFLTVCKAVSIAKHPTGLPYITIQWSLLPVGCFDTQGIVWHLSLTHTASLATAFLIVERL